MNSFGQIWNNILAVGIVFALLFWIYKNMEDTPFKRWLSNGFDSIKETIKNGKR